MHSMFGMRLNLEQFSFQSVNTMYIDFKGKRGLVTGAGKGNLKFGAWILIHYLKSNDKCVCINQV